MNSRQYIPNMVLISFFMQKNMDEHKQMKQEKKIGFCTRLLQARQAHNMIKCRPNQEGELLKMRCEFCSSPFQKIYPQWKLIQWWQHYFGYHTPYIQSKNLQNACVNVNVRRSMQDALLPLAFLYLLQTAVTDSGQ